MTKTKKEVKDFLAKQKEVQSSLSHIWKHRLAPEILGQRIVRLRYMTKTEAKDFGWYYRPLMMQLENGTWLIPSKDDECNDAGSVHLINMERELKESLAPVITIQDD